MYLHDYAFMVLEWLSFIFIGVVVFVLLSTILMFFVGIVYVWLKEFKPNTYQWLRKKLLRY